jgi:hypothetical protein
LNGRRRTWKARQQRPHGAVAVRALQQIGIDPGQPEMQPVHHFRAGPGPAAVLV